MLTDHGILLFASLLLGLLFLHRLQQIKQVWQAFGNIPSYFLPISPASPFSLVAARISWISGGEDFVWRNGYERQDPHEVYCSYSAHGLYIGIFAASNSDIVHMRSLSPFGVPLLLLADATATKVGPVSFEIVAIMLSSSTQTIFQSRTAFPKVARVMRVIRDFGYGPNLSSTENDEWRKHRRIAGPSFTESNNAFVWESSIEIILEYFIKWNRDGNGSIVKVSNFTEVTKQIAFMVFANAGR